MLTGYMDESYNNRTMCVAGWLANADKWTRIRNSWLERIEYERRISRKKGQILISRYHASDCASLKGEFSQWSKDRQIRFSKRLLEIIVECEPYGVVYGASALAFLEHFPNARKNWKKELYRLCMWRCLEEMGRVVRDYFNSEPVALIHDRGEFDKMADDAFERVRDHSPYSDCFVSMTEKGWEDCVPLQLADLLAFDGFKAIDAKQHGDGHLRRSLNKLFGERVPMAVAYVKPSLFSDIARKARTQQDQK